MRTRIGFWIAGLFVIQCVAAVSELSATSKTEPAKQVVVSAELPQVDNQSSQSNLVRNQLPQAAPVVNQY